MTLLLTRDEEDLRDSVRRFTAERSPIAKLRERLGSDVAYDAELWSQLSAQLGLSGLVVPVDYGGSGAGFSALAVVLEQLAMSLVASPLLAGALAAGVVLALDDPAAEGELLPAIASGEIVATLAGLDPAAATVVDGKLSGAPVAVNGAQADVVIVPATAEDGRAVLVSVRTGAPGVTLTPLTSIDHSRSMARVGLNQAPGRLLAGDASAAITRGADLANLALAAEQLGGMTACIAMTTDYAKLRTAFGQPIGAFQGVKHRLADLQAARELAHAALRGAAWAADHEPANFSVAASVARVMISDQYLEAATAAIQLHGGIGFTWEHDAHLYYKNAIAQRALFGTPREQLQRLNGLLAQH